MFPRNIPEHNYIRVIDPFRIIGNVYFVGTYTASSHLIDTGDGLILIDVGYMETAGLVIDGIHRLGFDPKDVKYIIQTHWHGDHTWGTPVIKALSGAKSTIGKDDAEKVLQYDTPDIIVNDGDVLTLGNTSIRFIHTPGHTKGTMSFVFDTEDNGKVYHVGMFGGAGANTLVAGHYDFDGAREAYRASLNRLRQEKVDVFIGNHTWNNDTAVKAEILKKTGENQFIDDKLFYQFLDHCEARLDRYIAKEKEDAKN